MAVDISLLVEMARSVVDVSGLNSLALPDRACSKHSSGGSGFLFRNRAPADCHVYAFARQNLLFAELALCMIRRLFKSNGLMCVI
jgi:hypothetical protein